jgi:hypothetical protein
MTAHFALNRLHGGSTRTMRGNGPRHMRRVAFTG